MKRNIKIVLYIIIVISISSIFAENKTKISNVASQKLTDNKLFFISYTSKLHPIIINTMHSWVLHVEDNKGVPVTNALIIVNGGMPEHDHGLPTQPRVTKNLGGGNYLLEGMRFHMGGLWHVTVTIHHKNKNDQVMFDLRL